ncbi:MAG: riboflavin biosynthesis protein RibF [Candidatus Omnitrophica bacterium]|nr:riboflavin biosynthesis protein RibF [Candidatus Omnitrophota bacterium]
MLLITDLRDFVPNPRKPLVIGLGNFDGVHLGHQALLKRVVQRAKKIRGRAAVFTFREHPQSILHPQKPLELLSAPEQKLSFFKAFGIELCFWKSFSRKFSALEAEDFVKKIILQKLGAREICLGTNARFGHNRKGNVALMRILSKRWGFRFEEIRSVKRERDFVSSSRIRELIKEGDLQAAGRCLGRPFSIFGKVIRGNGRGEKLGFPTANLHTSGRALPPHGVYPVSLRVIHAIQKQNSKKGIQKFRTAHSKKWLQGVLNYGHRPTFRGCPSKPVAEVFIMNFKGDLYGETLEVVFHPRLREEKAFLNKEMLKRQIQRDVQRAREYFQRNTLQRRLRSLY